MFIIKTKDGFFYSCILHRQDEKTILSKEKAWSWTCCAAFGRGNAGTEASNRHCQKQMIHVKCKYCQLNLFNYGLSEFISFEGIKQGIGIVLEEI